MFSSTMTIACTVCLEKPAFKTDGRGRWVCRSCLGDTRDPIVNVGRKWRRNEPCPCGSKKKFKACCYGNIRI